MSNFLIQVDKITLMDDISNTTLSIINNINNGRLKKQYNFILWYINEVMDLILDYDYYDEDMNLLPTIKYQTILNTMKQLLNKEYYGYSK